jgi:CheY-like chemotaxis protein
MNILIVEDSQAMRRMIRNVICAQADQCHECSDGSEALAAYTRHLPDWVLMDIEMKTMDGIAATEQIRATFPEAKIVIVTNYDDADLRQAALAAGASGYVLKENLLEIRRLLQHPTNASNVE